MNETTDAIDAARAEQLARVSGYPQAPTRKVRADENEIFKGELELIYYNKIY